VRWPCELNDSMVAATATSGFIRMTFRIRWPRL
jgi:hypothetical protein